MIFLMRLLEYRAYLTEVPSLRRSKSDRLLEYAPAERPEAPRHWNEIGIG